MRVQAVTAVLAGLALAAVPARARTHRDPEQPVTRALAFFQANAGDGGFEVVRRLRPAPLSPQARALVVAALPPEGELAPTAAERAKIASLDLMLELHERRDIVVVKVIDVGHAFVGLHAKTVLLLSRDALSLLKAEELQAVAAHEMAHESFWDEYADARARGDEARLQELELICDGVAVATARHLGQTPEALIDAVTKMTRYNERLGAMGTAGRYVPLAQRRQFIKDVAAVLDGRGQAVLSRFVP
jgi:hypothetical protein